MSTFKSKYKNKYTKDYDDMMSNDMSKRYRCNGCRCTYYRFCPHYRDYESETTAMILINFRRHNICPYQNSKPLNNNFMRVRKED